MQFPRRAYNPVLDSDSQHFLPFGLPLRHREHRASFIFCPIGRRRSGKRRCLSGQILCNQLPYAKCNFSIKGLPPKVEALFPGRHLPAREKLTTSVSSVSLWFLFFIAIRTAAFFQNDCFARITSDLMAAAAIFGSSWEHIAETTATPSSPILTASYAFD